MINKIELFVISLFAAVFIVSCGSDDSKTSGGELAPPYWADGAWSFMGGTYVHTFTFYDDDIHCYSSSNGEVKDNYSMSELYSGMMTESRGHTTDGGGMDYYYVTIIANSAIVKYQFSLYSSHPNVIQYNKYVNGVLSGSEEMAKQ